MSPFQIQAQPYLPGRIKGPLRIGTTAASRDGIVVIEQHELIDFQGACAALVVVDGKPFSHAMIRVQGYAIPTIIITREQAANLPADVELVLDGYKGLLFDPQLLPQNPPTDIEPPALFAPVSTHDDERVRMRASVANRTGVMRSLSCGASAIGLLRMEYLGASSNLPPDADFYTNELGTCCHAAEPLPLIARLPDFTTAKLPKWCKSLPFPFNSDETRGTRIYEHEPFKTLIDDILEGIGRCSEYYDLRLLLPYIDNVAEYVQLCDKIRTKLPDMIAIGALLETVNAVKQIKRFFAEADFIAIGTNDLIANLLGCARDSDKMNAYEPSIYQLLLHTAEQAEHRTKEIQVNGQLVCMPGVLQVLLGLGYRIFSVDPLLIPYLGEEIKQIDTTKAAELALRVCQARDADEVKQLLIAE